MVDTAASIAEKRGLVTTIRLDETYCVHSTMVGLTLCRQGIATRAFGDDHIGRRFCILDIDFFELGYEDTIVVVSVLVRSRWIRTPPG